MAGSIGQDQSDPFLDFNRSDEISVFKLNNENLGFRKKQNWLKGRDEEAHFLYTIHGQFQRECLLSVSSNSPLQLA